MDSSACQYCLGYPYYLLINYSMPPAVLDTNILLVKLLVPQNSEKKKEKRKGGKTGFTYRFSGGVADVLLLQELRARRCGSRGWCC